MSGGKSRAPGQKCDLPCKLLESLTQKKATNLDIIFSGTDGNECEAFIAAVRGIAFERGQDEDDRWMLRFATSRLRGGALRWHAQLDSSFRKDWDLFVQALFTQYPSVNSTDTPEPTAPLRYDQDIHAPNLALLLNQYLFTLIIALPLPLIPVPNHRSSHKYLKIKPSKRVTHISKGRHSVLNMCSKPSIPQTGFVSTSRKRADSTLQVIYNRSVSFEL